MRLKRFITVMMMLAVFSHAYAHDFVVTLNGQKVYFNIVSSIDKTAEVTYRGSIADGEPTYYEGELTVPSKVRHNDVVYNVVKIGPKAFSGADRLTGIILPEGLNEIGDFAFEGCTSLAKVIFPGNTVRFGEGVFFRCDKIRDVSFGSGWRNLELKMFRWSDSLVSLTIPAKVEKIRNMKSLKNLQSISVDNNSTRFSSVDGILYNKSCETLYGCPRAYQGALKVAEGTRYVTAGAFIDCDEITGIDLPDSLVFLAFNEFSRMEKLHKVVFRGADPVMTAVDIDGNEVFLLQVVRDADVEIIVPRKSLKKYRRLSVGSGGEYSIIGEGKPYLVEPEKILDKESIIGKRNMSKIEL